MLNAAKSRALKWYDDELPQYKDAFRAHVKGPLCFDTAGARQRIADAVFMERGECLLREAIQDEVWGQTDGAQIWINPFIEDEDDMVRTLLHEALHDFAFRIRPTRLGTRKPLSMDMEHKVMKGLQSCM